MSILAHVVPPCRITVIDVVARLAANQIRHELLHLGKLGLQFFQLAAARLP